MIGKILSRPQNGDLSLLLDILMEPLSAFRYSSPIKF